jgi:RimJ/RimL family protein N-acetyltransferase
MRELTIVGALIRDARHRVYAHRRSSTRRLFPGIWDIVGGHLEPGETPLDALAREIEEETGWRLRHVEATVADWEWEHDGVTRREFDYLVEVDGDLSAPRLEAGKHDASAWIGPDNLDLMMSNRSDGDRRLRDLVAKATRIRLTERLLLVPIGPEVVGDLWRLHWDEAVAAWYGARWTANTAIAYAARMRQVWESAGVGKWMAYRRGTGELVGRGGLSRIWLDGAERLEVGWTVRRECWGQGYATEIGRAGLAYAVDELAADEVVAYTEPHNLRSRAVMERLGMRYARDTVHGGTPFVLYES